MRASGGPSPATPAPPQPRTTRTRNDPNPARLEPHRVRPRVGREHASRTTAVQVERDAVLRGGEQLMRQRRRGACTSARSPTASHMPARSCARARTRGPDARSDLPEERVAVRSATASQPIASEQTRHIKCSALTGEPVAIMRVSSLLSCRTQPSTAESWRTEPEPAPRPMAERQRVTATPTGEPLAAALDRAERVRGQAHLAAGEGGGAGREHHPGIGFSGTVASAVARPRSRLRVS